MIVLKVIIINALTTLVSVVYFKYPRLFLLVSQYFVWYTASSKYLDILSGCPVSIFNSLDRLLYYLESLPGYHWLTRCTYGHFVSLCILSVSLCILSVSVCILSVSFSVSLDSCLDYSSVVFTFSRLIIWSAWVSRLSRQMSRSSLTVYRHFFKASTLSARVFI